MFRYIYTICDLIATVFALLSPVAVMHWLLKVTEISALQGFVRVLDPLFVPMDGVLELFIQLPHLNYNGHSYATTQGLLACLLTVLFFVFNFLAETARVWEQRVNVQVHAAIQRRRLQKLRDEQYKREDSLPKDLKVFGFVDYDVAVCPTIAKTIDLLIAQEGAHIHSRMFNELILEFKKIEDGLRFVLTLSQSILSHYNTLRPMDPQPPFRMALDGQDNLLDVSAAVIEVRRLIHYVGVNQIVVSETAKALLEISASSLPHSLQSMGLYTMGVPALEQHGVQRELFQLKAKKAADF